MVFIFCSSSSSRRRRRIFSSYKIIFFHYGLGLLRLDGVGGD